MDSKDNLSNKIPKTHPRYESLKYRHKIIDGMKNLLVAEAGLIAHGRGECFDYILGEKTTFQAKLAMKAAIATLMLAKNPVISVNGNVAALVPDELATLANILKIPLEINLFYQKKGRIKAIKKVLKKAGAEDIRGINKKKMIELHGLESNRRKVEFIGKADVILVPLEDGDRTEALKRLNKTVIAIDLNPISRTALWADITIIDNIIRAIPEMINIVEELKLLDRNQLKAIVTNFNNRENIQISLELIIKYIEKQKEEAFNILNL